MTQRPARTSIVMLLREGVLDAELGGWSLIRRAERVSRPARLNSRRRSVFVVTMPSVAWPTLALMASHDREYTPPA